MPLYKYFINVSCASQSKDDRCPAISVDLIAFNTSITLLACVAYKLALVLNYKL